MEWYIWVIISLSLVIILLLVTIWRAARAAEKVVLKFIIKPWIEGNFGKRGQQE